MAWVKENLGNRLKVISGYAFKSLDFLDIKEQNIPVIKIKNIKNGFVDIENDTQYVSQEKLNIDNKFKVFNGDILISLTGSQITQPNSVVGRIAKCYFNDNQIALLNQRAGKFIINEEKLNKDFLLYLLSNDKYKQKLALMGHGAASQANISPSQVESLEVYLPNKVEEQQKIANVLSNYDDLIENNNKRIKILEEMAQKIYKEWFVDFKFPNHETATFKQTELGKIPTDWDVINANQIADIFIGRTPSRKDFDCFTTNKKDKKWISIKDIGLSNEFIFDTSEYLTQEAIKKYNVPLIPQNTVILSFKLTVGKITITTEEMTSNEAIAQFQIKNKEQIPTNYLYLYLKNFEYNNLGNTSSIGNAINSTIVKNMPIIVPKEKVVKEFDKNITSIFNQIKNLTLKNTNLKQTRDLLLPRLISGEIDVENLEIV